MNTESVQTIRNNKPLISEVSPVPWIDSTEFRAVGQALLSAVTLEHDEKTKRNDTGNPRLPLSLQDSLLRIENWKARSASPLPASVESTAALAVSIWRDMGSEVSYSAPPLFTELRMMYSCAIIRTINGLADPFQQNRAMFGSVAQVCSQIGVPLWLVELRHEATHNQLPSLSVLRVGAITLLKYLKSVYWEPLEIVQTRDQEMVWRCLGDLLDAPPRVEGRKHESFPKHKSFGSTNFLLPVDEDGNSAQDEFFDFGGSSGDEQPENVNLGYEHGVARLGTSSNMFAALMDTKKPKKRDRDPFQQAKEASNGREEKPRPKKKQIVRPQEFFVDQLFSTTVPLDTIWHAVLCYLLIGIEKVDGSCEAGYFIPNSATDYPSTDGSILKLRQRFNPLLTPMGRQWPGLIRSLLIHIVDFIVSIQIGGENKEDQRKLFFLESWIRYLVSQSFVCRISTQRTFVVENNVASFKQLECLQYRLNGLCDRLEACSLSLTEISTVQRIHKLFLSILAENRVVNHGTQNSKSAWTTPLNNGRPTGTIVDAVGTSATGDLTLDQFETILAGDGGNFTALEHPEHAIVSIEPSHSPSLWTKCANWESCPIGVLPGYPP